jgi:hypothetical protein
MPLPAKRPEALPDNWLPASWPAPPSIRAGSTARTGGASAGAYDSFNLAAHVGDEPARVAANRRRLRHMLDLPAEPCWLEQQHGARVIDAAQESNRCADAAWSGQSGVACAVLSADCVPILLCNRAGTEVAAVHAGWRGICAGVIQSAVERFRSPAGDLLAWFGPHITKESYQVGEDMWRACQDSVPDAAAAFTAAGDRRWRADLARLSCNVLLSCGVNSVHDSGWCTFGDAARFYSFRRAPVTGRMATLIWIG